MTQAPEALEIRRARPEDVDALVALGERTSDWVRARGYEPGALPRPLREIVAERVGQGVTYVALLGGVLVGTLTLTWSDPQVWGDLPASAAYVHGLAVHREYAGRQIGTRLLQWAAAWARAAGMRALRLDCAAENPRLRAYYAQAGFAPRGEVRLPHRVAARFELPLEGEVPCT